MTLDKDRVSFLYLSLYISNLSFCLLLGILLEQMTGTVRQRLLVVQSRMIGRDDLEEGDYSELCYLCISFFIKNLLTII